MEPHSQPENSNSAYDNPAFRDVLRKVVDTPKEEVERGLAAQKTQRIKKRRPVKSK
jgi:hypothetical protein